MKTESKLEIGVAIAQLVMYIIQIFRKKETR